MRNLLYIRGNVDLEAVRENYQELDNYLRDYQKEYQYLESIRGTASPEDRAIMDKELDRVFNDMVTSFIGFRGGVCKGKPAVNDANKQGLGIPYIKIGHTTPWNAMTSAEKAAFQHSYSRHARELGLPNWRATNATALQQQFNNVVSYIRSSGTLTQQIKPFNGQLVRVNYYEAKIQGIKYYYYETLSGKFISAGKAR